MIKTLRITSVAAVILAGIVLASVVGPASLIGFGVRGDRQVEKILAAPSAVDRFKERHGDKDQGNRDTTPPLVKQAELFSDMLKPRVAATAQSPAATARAPARPVAIPQVVSADFDLVGISCSSIPGASFAYIRLSDQTYQWVQPGSQIGHVVVKEVRNGSVVYWDGRQDVEKPVEQPPETASMLETGKALSAPATPAISQPTVGMVGKTLGRPAVPPTAPSQPVAGPADASIANLSPEDQAAYNDLVTKLKDMDMDPANRAAAAKRLMDEFKSSRVSPQEAEKLGNLGEELNGSKDGSKDEKRREFLKRLSAPRPTKN
jgi:hypothetical protein